MMTPLQADKWLIFVIIPLIEFVALPASAASALLNGDALAYMVGIPAIVPAFVAAYSVVGERQQGTLEPVLTTPIRREELLLAKALAALVPSLAIAYAVYAFVLACIELFAQLVVASALIRGPDLLALLLFTPLLATWSIWVAIAISTRTSDARVAQQLGVLGGSRRSLWQISSPSTPSTPRSALPSASRRCCSCST